MEQKEWMEIWKERLHEAHFEERDAFVARLDNVKGLVAAGEKPPRDLDPSALLEQELRCEAVDSAPQPYVLNVGCGYRPTSIGQRTKDGLQVYVVGVDPKAYEMGDALLTIASLFPALASARRFVLPIVAEEMSMAVPSGSFHAVWSEDAILDCVDPLRFVQQCVRATRPGGVACIKFAAPGEEGGTLWKTVFHDGGKIMFQSERGDCGIAEVRGERIEVHTLLDGALMLKVRRQARADDQVLKFAERAGLLVPGRRK